MIFLMRNGDVYMVEPYSRQQSLSAANLSFRDYYKGAIDTKNVILGGVITGWLFRPQPGSNRHAHVFKNKQ